MSEMEEFVTARSTPEDDDRPVISIRSRVEPQPPYEKGDPPNVPAYVVYPPANPSRVIAVFGQVQGGATREEAVFWAERFASKNDYRYEAPLGWEHVEGKLPPEEPPVVEPLYVRVAPEIVERLEQDWSEPIQFRVVRGERGDELEMTLRTIDLTADVRRYREALQRITSPRTGAASRDTLRRIAREALESPD